MGEPLPSPQKRSLGRAVGAAKAIERGVTMDHGCAGCTTVSPRCTLEPKAPLPPGQAPRKDLWYFVPPSDMKELSDERESEELRDEADAMRGNMVEEAKDRLHTTREPKIA